MTADTIQKQEEPRNPWKESCMFYFDLALKRGQEIITYRRKIAKLENELAVARRIINQSR